MAARARHDENPRSDARNVVAAYAGSTRAACTLAPALNALRGSCPDAAVWLLWPANVACPRDLDRGADGRIDYPVPLDGGESPLHGESRAELLRSLRRTVKRLVSAEACAALVFTEAGYEPYLPAYLCYLAGVRHRAAFSGEFGGRVLSATFRPPPGEGAARHLELLRAASPMLVATVGSLQRSARCDG